MPPEQTAVEDSLISLTYEEEYGSQNLGPEHRPGYFAGYRRARKDIEAQLDKDFSNPEYARSLITLLESRLKKAGLVPN